MKKIIPICILIIVVQYGAIGQQYEPCATVAYNKARQQSNPNPETEQQFEEWIKSKKQERKRFLVHAAPYTVPIVFHIIHNGEPEGVGTNISSAFIRRQVEILNQDFQRRNKDAYKTPADFQNVAGSMDITFVLAQQDPEGRLSDGIVRINGNKEEWNHGNASLNAIKYLSYWPSQDYFNVWIANIASYSNGASLLGLAQYPQSNRLQGIVPPFDDEKTDGVLLSYKIVGANNPHRLRVLTHEVGHFLGLRHIWGDDGICGGDGDYVADTPSQYVATQQQGCPVHPVPDCDEAKMFQNYMDYTNDECINLFTRQQVDRMKIVMDYSPRRASFASSKGAILPPLGTNNLGITHVISPKTASCNLSAITPHIQVRNYGVNPISSARIQMRINGEVAQIKDIAFTPSLGQLEIDTVFYDALTLDTAGSYQFAFNVLQANETIDDILENDTLALNVRVPYSTEIPFLETFDREDLKWEIQNPDNSITWKSVETNNDGFLGKSIYLDFYNYAARESVDNLVSPLIKFPEFGNSSSKPVLKFDWFYPTSTFNNSDSLQVVFTSGCDPNLSNGIIVFSKAGDQLTTTTGSSAPSSVSQWNTAAIPLDTEIASLENLQVVFSGINGYSSSLYIDNISILYPHEIPSLYRVHSNPASSDIRITFNLTSRALVHWQVYTTMGISISAGIIPDALDQTYVIPMEQYRTGIYILRLQFDNRVEVSRIFFSP